MTQEEINKGNRLIAEFMGKAQISVNVQYRTKKGLASFDIKDMSNERWNNAFLLYHKSWGWLMPVVHKAFDQTTEDERSFAGLALFEIGIATPIEEVFKCVVDFIKWYNINK